MDIVVLSNPDSESESDERERVVCSTFTRFLKQKIVLQDSNETMNECHDQGHDYKLARLVDYYSSHMFRTFTVNQIYQILKIARQGTYI